MVHSKIQCRLQHSALHVQFSYHASFFLERFNVFVPGFRFTTIPLIPTNFCCSPDHRNF